MNPHSGLSWNLFKQTQADSSRGLRETRTLAQLSSKNLGMGWIGAEFEPNNSDCPSL